MGKNHETEIKIIMPKPNTHNKPDPNVIEHSYKPTAKAPGSNQKPPKVTKK